MLLNISAKRAQLSALPQPHVSAPIDLAVTCRQMMRLRQLGLSPLTSSSSEGRGDVRGGRRHPRPGPSARIISASPPHGVGLC